MPNKDLLVYTWFKAIGDDIICNYFQWLNILKMTSSHSIRLRQQVSLMDSYILREAWLLKRIEPLT